MGHLFTRRKTVSKNKITFRSVEPSLAIDRPTASTKNVPSWYRTMPGVTDKISTVKKCVPFLDAFAMGYHIPLMADVEWNKETEEFSFSSKIPPVSHHYSSQTQEVDLPPEFDPQPHKWNNAWQIKTPRGYSTLFIHPLNRLDLPFYSFTGVVDTDKHPLIINFPFVLRKDFNGLIPQGTPIIQAIPFKRDKWSSSFLDSLMKDKHNVSKISHENAQPPFGWYKRNFWSRKEYR